MFVASDIVKRTEVPAVGGHDRFHAILMSFTALMVAGADFLIGVVAALVLYAILQ